jgi:alkylation response protein AidB-like acyl-CoA dehydrogenase
MQSDRQAFARFALLARWTAAAEAVLVADDALQVFGGFGFSREYPAERSLRDARYLGLGEFDHASAARELAEA